MIIVWSFVDCNPFVPSQHISKPITDLNHFTQTLRKMADSLTMLSAALFLIGTLGFLVNGFIVYKMVRNRRNFNEHTILFVNVAVRG